MRLTAVNTLDENFLFSSSQRRRILLTRSNSENIAQGEPLKSQDHAVLLLPRWICGTAHCPRESTVGINLKVIVRVAADTSSSATLHRQLS